MGGVSRKVGQTMNGGVYYGGSGKTRHHLNSVCSRGANHFEFLPFYYPDLAASSLGHNLTLLRLNVPLCSEVTSWLVGARRSCPFWISLNDLKHVRSSCDWSPEPHSFTLLAQSRCLYFNDVTYFEFPPTLNPRVFILTDSFVQLLHTLSASVLFCVCDDSVIWGSFVFFQAAASHRSAPPDFVWAAWITSLLSGEVKNSQVSLREKEVLHNRQNDRKHARLNSTNFYFIFFLIPFWSLHNQKWAFFFSNRFAFSTWSIAIHFHFRTSLFLFFSFF